MINTSIKRKMVLVIIIWSILLLVTNLIAGIYVNAYKSYANYVSIALAGTLLLEMFTYVYFKLKNS